MCVVIVQYFLKQLIFTICLIDTITGRMEWTPSMSVARAAAYRELRM
jgi:hypothetical protein